MTNGIVAELKELISLRRDAQTTYRASKQKALRAGSHLSSWRGRGMDFAEVRHYQPGDEIRHMEWRVTARTGKPQVKIYQEERERPVVLLVDFNPSMLFGTKGAFKSVVAARLAALIAWTVMNQKDRVGGFLFSATKHSEFTPRARLAGVLPLLASLSHYTMATSNLHQEKPRILSDALIRLRRVIKPGSILILISDFYHLDGEAHRHLYRLREHNNIMAYHICDQIELAPPKPGLYPITDGENELLLDTTSKTFTLAYRDYFQKKATELQDQCRRFNIQYHTVSAQMELSTLVRDSFCQVAFRRGYGGT